MANIPTEYINFRGADWAVIKLYLEKMLQNKIGLLIGCTSHDDSNTIRGAISAIKQILALESAANQPQ